MLCDICSPSLHFPLYKPERMPLAARGCCHMVRLKVCNSRNRGPPPTPLHLHYHGPVEGRKSRASQPGPRRQLGPRVHCRVLSSSQASTHQNPGAPPPQVTTTKNVPRCCQMPSEADPAEVSTLHHPVLMLPRHCAPASLPRPDPTPDICVAVSRESLFKRKSPAPRTPNPDP